MKEGKRVRTKEWRKESIHSIGVVPDSERDGSKRRRGKVESILNGGVYDKRDD